MAMTEYASIAAYIAAQPKAAQGRAEESAERDPQGDSAGEGIAVVQDSDLQDRRSGS